MEDNRKNKREQSRIINNLFKEEKYSEARTFIFGLMKNNPDDHWLLSRLSTTYYEGGNYQEALKYVEQALKIAHYCPLVLWDYAGTLDMLERNDEAIQIYKRLVRKGASRIAHGACGEGIQAARSLVNDSRYRLGLIYARKVEFLLAKKYFKDYITNRHYNYSSIYNLREVKKDLKIILERKDPHRLT